ncbi:MAG: orotate phosphoribosyltransferase [Clostridia bacterium]|nr:orotate phosphoribosyltransferase [Clostridia bacterium]
METRAMELTSGRHRAVVIRAIEGHFVTQHSHVSHCIDMTKIKSQTESAKAAARLFAADFYNTPVDTIITLERTKMVGAFLADELSRAGINLQQDIAVITPEITGEKLFLRDNLLPYVKNRRVLLLTATATTGMTLLSALEGIVYYGGTPTGAATVFGGDFGTEVKIKGAEMPVPVVRLFGTEDIAGYSSYHPNACPLCRAGVKVDAVVNSYGYSKI